MHDLGQFERTTVPGWDGQSTDSFFSATLVRYVTGSDYHDDYEHRRELPSAVAGTQPEHARPTTQGKS
jgi:hypothetical protein